jgi:ABC-type multidrug transport system fused ATPase/permease subunit
MKKLEKKILKKVYFWEAKRTIFDLFLKMILFFSSGLFLLIFGQIFFEILNEQKTLDLLNFFSEDFEVVKKYFLDNIFIFFFEMPKFLLLLLLLFLAIFSLVILTLIKNFYTLKNKVKSFLNFFKKI